MKALIIGCGSIGALKPEHLDNLKTGAALTHAHAAFQNDVEPHFYDIDPSRARAASARWNGWYYTNLDVALDGRPWDIVVVAVPTSLHWQTVRRVLDYIKPGVLIMEKPCGQDRDECEKIVVLAEEKGVPLIVNYNRGFIDLPQLRDGEKVKSFRAIYTRGLLRDGCHALEMAFRYCGNLNRITAIGPVINEVPGDPTIGFMAEFDRCLQVIFTPVRGDDYCVFDIDILTNQRRIMMPLSGAQIWEWRVEKEPVYGDYQSLTLPNPPVYTHLANALGLMWKKAIQAAQSGKLDGVSPNGATALIVHGMIKKIKKCI